MHTRKRRLLVGSVSSIAWPAVALLVPVGITFAAARVYAEGAPPPEACEAGVVIDCADAASGDPCHTCGSGACACFSGGCTDGGAGFEAVLVCRETFKCADFPNGEDPRCQGKAVGAPCDTAGSWCVRSTINCLPDDGGALLRPDVLVCSPNGSGMSSSSSSSSGGDDDGGVDFVPGPPTVPGSDLPSSEETEDDSGCSTSSNGARLPLLGVPIAIGLLLALRRPRRRR